MADTLAHRLLSESVDLHQRQEERNVYDDGYLVCNVSQTCPVTEYKINETECYVSFDPEMKWTAMSVSCQPQVDTNGMGKYLVPDMQSGRVAEVNADVLEE